MVTLNPLLSSLTLALAILGSLLLIDPVSADPPLQPQWVTQEKNPPNQLQLQDLPPDSNQNINHVLLPRQATTPPAANTPQATPTNTLQAAASNTPQGTAARGTPAASAASSSVFSAPADAPVGGLIFTQPPATAAALFYKIAQNQPLTFGWNYTNVLSFGQSITIVAFCSLNKVSYTISTLPAQATAITWDPFALQQQPGYPLFAEATYTLQIFDERGIGAGPTPGLMAPSSSMKFAMYKPQPYTPLASWTCSTCSGAKGFFSNYSPVLLACGLSVVTAIGGGWFGVLAAIR